MIERERSNFSAKAAIAAALALMLANCAGAPPVKREAVNPAPTSGPQFADIGGVNVAYPEFQNSAFPYRGPIPVDTDNPGPERPFLNVNENGRLGHSSARGGV